MDEQQPFLQLQNVSKQFGGTVALDDVNLAVRSGEVHALIGENGAGKSTLMKVLSGAYQPDEGEIYLDGEHVEMDNPLKGRRLGVAMIYQELNLAPHMTVQENLELGMEDTTLGFVKSQREEIEEVLELLGHTSLPLDTPVRRLGVGKQQVVEIARALLTDARVIIMDEPTSSLSAEDTEALFSVIRKLRDAGYSIIYISHFLEEATEVADRYTVLRDGEVAGTGSIEDMSERELIRLMIGRSLNEMFPSVEREPGEPLLDVEDLQGPVPDGVSFTLRRGEILGIAGLVGAGRSETVRSIFGLESADEGYIDLAERGQVHVKYLSPRRSLDLGLDLMSENRNREGLALNMSVAENMTLSSLDNYAGFGGWGLLNVWKERRAVRDWIDEMDIQCRGAEQQISTLSGGNQQKVALTRLLEAGSDILLLDEPTRGIDVGTKVQIYRLMGELASEGRGIVFVSSYLPELLGVTDRLGVMYQGRMSDIYPTEDWTEEDVMRFATTGR